MLKELKFCMGSVAKKDFIPALTHFVIENGRVRGFNGVLALSTPIPFDIQCRPKADMLIKAIANCEDTIQLAMTPAGRLSVKSGKFKTFIDCVQEETAHALPEGALTKFDGAALFEGIKKVAPFIGSDASRRWAQGILIRDGSLFATNNVILVQYWIGNAFPNIINIPKPAVVEMLRINEPPLFAQIGESSITFHYSEDRWLRTQLYSTEEWPDLSRILDKPSNQQPIQEELFKALEAVKPFTDKSGSVLYCNNVVTTHMDEAEGSRYEVEGIPETGRYNIEMLQLLDGVVTTIDWSLYPEPCLFSGGMLRGAIVGMKL